MRDQRVYLLHAIDAIDAILGYTTEGSDGFFADAKTQDAVIRNIEIIGEAVKGLSDDTRSLDPAVPWRQIAGMRDKLTPRIFRRGPCAGLGRGRARTTGAAFATRTTQPALGDDAKLA